MSGIINKVKETIAHHGDHSSHGEHHQTDNTYDSAKSSNHGPHDSNIANAADPRVDSDRSGRAAYDTTSTGPTSTEPLATGAGQSSVDSYNTPAGQSGNIGGLSQNQPSTFSSTTGPASTTAGPHSSNMGELSQNQPSTFSSTTGPASTTAGPHSSNMANKADPLVDSDRSRGVMNAGDVAANSRDTTADNFGSMGGVSQGRPSTHSPTTGPASATAGPHESNLANKADPRVDSDRSKEPNNTGDVAGDSRFMQDVHKSSIGGADVMQISGSSGPTTTKTFEEAQDNSAAAGSSYNQSNTTAGPHKSDMANKLDPRVDSDLDGSKTIGSQRV